ncbi:MAG: hypothetical protein VB111_04555 [Clostridiaceae bacterium]|nr:hypothetical protein [Clostridiaceae bacterium]
MNSRNDVTSLFPTAPGVRIYQLTQDGVSHSGIYPETPVWLEDRRHFLITGENGYEISSLDGEPPVSILPRVLPDGARPTSACISRDGRWFYHLRVYGEGLTVTSSLWRVDTRTLTSEKICDTPDRIDGFHPSHFYGIGTISSDGERFATSAFLGDGTQENAPAGLLVYDIPRRTCILIAADSEWHNSHLQYCQSTDPDASHDLLLQMNHGMLTSPDGRCTRHLEPPPSGLGADIHVIRDDGTHWRDLPWGRDGLESCIGHQAWRTDSTSCITITLQNMDPSYGLEPHTRQHVIEAYPIPTNREEPHIGAKIPGAKRRILDEGFENPRFCHFFCSADGSHFAFDTFICEGEGTPKGETGIGQRVYIALDDGERLHFQYICNTRGKFLGEGSNHAHPILTPDNSGVLFNSTVSGKSQIYLAEGFSW